MREGEQEGGEAAVEVQIYSGIEFTRFHQGPVSFLFLPCSHPFPLKSTWCKLTLASRQSGGRKERLVEDREKGIGHRKSRESEISAILVRSEECLHFVPREQAAPHTGIKTTPASTQASPNLRYSVNVLQPFICPSSLVATGSHLLIL